MTLSRRDFLKGILKSSAVAGTAVVVGSDAKATPDVMLAKDTGMSLSAIDHMVMWSPDMPHDITITYNGKTYESHNFSANKPKWKEV